MDFNDILGDVVGALKDEMGDGFSSVSAFVEDQGRLLAKQAEWIAKSRATGSLKGDDELFDFFLDGLETNAENFARAVAMASILTIEKAWNAVANALWGGIRTVLSGAGVPANLLPPVPPLRI